jgi:hypothetical protein
MGTAFGCFQISAAIVFQVEIEDLSLPKTIAKYPPSVTDWLGAYPKRDHAGNFVAVLSPAPVSELGHFD